jgi:hypothetical protein
VTYATKVAHLSGTLSGGRNGSYLLNSSTVLNDIAVNLLTGESGLDWFIVSALDIVTDQNTGGTETKSVLH